MSDKYIKKSRNWKLRVDKFRLEINHANHKGKLNSAFGQYNNSEKEHSF